MALAFNHRHLYYFWVVAKEGSMTRAAQRLDMAVQTVSAQVRELERDLGCQLLRPAGRGLALAPRVLMHPVGEPVGGLTQVEIRALQEMARGAGAHGVTVWQGPLLTDEQVLARQYPAAGQVLA